jgi:DNA-binding NtrC family response regulator
MEQSDLSKILIVDDEKSIIDAFREIFSQTDYVIEYAHNAQETIEKLESGSYNIVVLDTTLPGTDAFELLESIKNLDPGIRVIMMAWHTSARTIADAFQKRASEFILKPFQANDVLKKVRKSLLFQRLSKARERTQHLMPLD